MIQPCLIEKIQIPSNPRKAVFRFRRVVIPFAPAGKTGGTVTGVFEMAEVFNYPVECRALAEGRWAAGVFITVSN